MTIRLLTVAALVLQIAIAGPAVALPSHHALAPAGQTASVGSSMIPRRTGVPEVDRLLDAADARRVDRLHDLVGSFKVGCVKKPLFGNTGYILCHPHESAGTPVPVIVAGYRNGCEAQYIRLARARDALRVFVSESPEVYAAFRLLKRPDYVPHSIRYGVIFSWGDQQAAVITLSARGRILELFLWACDSTPDNVLSGWPDIEVLLNPPGASAGASDAVSGRLHSLLTLDGQSGRTG